MHYLDASVPIPTIPLTAGTWRSIAGALSLSARELQFVQGVFRGDSERMIADHLGISRHTVHTYSDRVYRKLHISGRTELVVRVFAEYLRLD